MRFKKILINEGKNTSIFFITTTLTSILSFLIIPLYWSKLSLSDYGVIAVSEIITGILGLILGLNLDQGLTRFYHEWSDDNLINGVSSIWTTYILVIFLMAPFVYFFCYIFSGFLFPKINFFPYINLGIIIGILSPLEKLPMVLFRMEEKPYLFSFSTISNFLITNLISVVLIFKYNLGAEGYLMAVVTSKVIMNLYYFYYLNVNYGLNISYKVITEPIRFSVNFILNDVISILSTQGDKFLIQLYLDIRILGIYTICLKFGNLFTSLHTVIKTSFVPLLLKSARNSEELKIIKHIVPFYVTPLFIGLLGVTYFSKFIIEIIGKEEYFITINYLPVVCLALFIPTLYIYYAPGIFLSKKSTYVLAPTVLSSLLFLILSYFLIPYFGFYGVIISKVISALGYLFFSIYLSHKLYEWGNDYKFLLKISLISSFYILVHYMFLEDSFVLNLLIFTSYFIFICYLLLDKYQKNNLLIL